MGLAVTPGIGQADPVTYVRALRDSQDLVTTFQTAILPFRSADGAVAVDLVGAVHIGDKAYYADLNRRFAAYDAVLFELVAPTEALTHEARQPESMRGGKRSGLSAVQLFMTRMLSVSFQLDEINYAAKNFVHADMSPAELKAEMERRGESFLGVVLRLLLAGATMPKESQESLEAEQLKMLLAALSPERANIMKRSLAAQFNEMDYLLSSIVENGGSSIVVARNDQALRVLQRELKSGKKRIAIFYGAAHLPDLAKKLRANFALTPGTVEWVTAWNIPVVGAKGT